MLMFEIKMLRLKQLRHIETTNVNLQQEKAMVLNKIGNFEIFRNQIILRELKLIF